MSTFQVRLWALCNAFGNCTPLRRRGRDGRLSAAKAISKKSFRPISALMPRFKSSAYVSMPAALNLGLALISRENPDFEKASFDHLPPCVMSVKPYTPRQIPNLIEVA
jgi:hypothetical protein